MPGVRPPRFDPEELVDGIEHVVSLSISPGGSEAAFTLQRSGAPLLCVSSIDDFSPRILTEGAGLPQSQCWWSPDGRKIAFIRDHGGDERYDLFTVDVRDGSVARLTSLDRASFRGAAWSPDGRSLAFSSDWEEPFRIYTIGADGTCLRGLTEGFCDTGPSWSPDGGLLAFTRSGGDSSRSRIIVTDAAGVVAHSAEVADGNLFASCWALQGIRLWSDSGEHGSAPVGLLDPSTLRIEWSAECANEFSRVWSGDGRVVACLQDDGRNRIVSLVDQRTGGLKPIGPAAGLCRALECTPDGSRLLFVHEGPRTPSGLVRHTVSTGETELLTSGLPESINPEHLPEPEEIWFTSFDGMRIPGWLYRPGTFRQGSRLPAILRIHGGPNYQSFNRWDATIQMLLSHGYLVLAPNFRGSTGYGHDFTRLSEHDWGGGDMKDIVAAAGYLVDEGLADPGRIGLWGGSYGGYLTLMAMAKAPLVWAAGVCMYGFTDLEVFYRNIPPWMQQWMEAQVGKPEDAPEFYRERSPMTWCSGIRAPLLFLQGADDPRVPLVLSRLLEERMIADGRDFALKVYPDEGHGFRKIENQIDSMRMLLEFFDRHMVTR